VLAFLQEANKQDGAGHWFSATDLAALRAAAFDGTPLERRPTRSEVESVRRAIRKLAAVGLVEAEDYNQVSLWRDPDLAKLTPQDRVDADIARRFSQYHLCACLPDETAR
jgi:hypothetical protein